MFYGFNKMNFLKYVFAPKLYKEYGPLPYQIMYEPGRLEKWGDQIITTLLMMWNITYYTSPLIITVLYRRGYLVVESVASLAKLATGIGIIVVISLCMRGFGRSQSSSYVKLMEALGNLKKSNLSSELKKKYKMFDFDFKYWPIDFDVNQIEENIKKPISNSSTSRRTFLLSSLPCELAAYIAIHTFGIKMIYPGSLQLLQSYLNPMLIQGRSRFIEVNGGERFKVKTKDGNEIDSLFIDNRTKDMHGRTLVICSEGNAGFYEIGLMSTPLALNYSVLGWNHPGFGSSSGKPYLSEDQNAIDAIIQFAIHSLKFIPENIVLFGWSIGGYSSLYAASQYKEIKGIILDATFDDILYLALARMPESLSGIVKLALRNYVNLNNSDLITKTNSPLLLIRRTEDEVICTEEGKLGTNRANNLLVNLLKYRFPNIFKTKQIDYAYQILESPLEIMNQNENNDELSLSWITSYVADSDKKYPLLIGADYDNNQKQQLASYLIRKHLVDLKSTHCTPLPKELFQMPWDIPSENDFVFT